MTDANNKPDETPEESQEETVSELSDDTSDDTPPKMQKGERSAKAEDADDDEGVEMPESIEDTEVVEDVAEDDDRTSTAELEAVSSAVAAPDEYPEGQGEELQERMEDIEGGPNAIERASVEVLQTTEEASKESSAADSFDNGVETIQESIETTAEKPDGPDDALSHDLHGDTTVFMGREYPMPLYTFVFAILGALTLIEVVLAEIISSDIKIPFLLGIAIAKAALVVYFYMHLNTDSRVFAVALAVPVAIALLATLFLLGVPTTGY